MQSTQHLKRLILAGMLGSMGTALKLFSLTTGEFRFSFYDIPLFFGGMVLGPFLGLIIGFAADWGYVLLDPRAVSFNLMTVSAMLWGFAGGYFYLRKKVGWTSLSIVIILTSMLAFTINSVQLYLWIGPGMLAQVPLRIGSMMLKWPLQIMVMKILYERVFLNSPFDLSYTTKN